MRFGRVLGRGFRVLGGALTQSYFDYYCRLTLALGFVLVCLVNPALAQQPQVCATGQLCQGSGCTQGNDTNNPSDTVNFSLPANEVANILITRSDNQPPDDSACALSVNVVNSPGTITNGLVANTNNTVPLTGSNSTGPSSTNVEYTANQKLLIR